MSTDKRLEDSYLGEPAPRRPWVAFALSLLCPGLGFAYLGRFGTAVLFALASVALWAGFVLAWSLLGFHPRLPLIGFALGWLGWVLLGAEDAAREARRAGADHVLGDWNHPLAYTAVAVFAFGLPLAGVHHWATTHMWTLGVVHGDTMYPTLVEGDEVWIDRRAYRRALPAHADVVAFRPLPESAIQFGRVVGLPGDTVAMAGAAAYVNDSPLLQRYVDEGTRDEIQTRRGVRDATSILVEEHGGRHYLVAATSALHDATPREWAPEDALYVAHDLRESVGLVRVERQMLVGRPVFGVARSVDGERPAEFRVQPAWAY